MSGRAPSGWQGPLRAAVAVFAVGFLVVWLVKPLGNPCPDLTSLPQGSTASSSPSFSPPGSRTCTYTVAGGTEARVKHVPWLDWIVLLLLAAAAGGAVRFVSPAGRDARAQRVGRPAPARRAPGAEPEPRAGAGRRGEQARGGGEARAGDQARPDAPARPPRRAKAPKPERPRPGASGRDPASPTERDAADRERARRERAARDRARRTR